MKDIMNEQLENLLSEKGADIVRFVDISNLPADQTQGFTRAVLFCMALSKSFIVTMRNGKGTESDEFVAKEQESWEMNGLRAWDARAWLMFSNAPVR